MRHCLLWLLLVSLLGCVSVPAQADIIHLAHLQPLPPVPSNEIKPLRVAVAAIISPQGTVDSYTLLLDYLSQTLERPLQLVQRRTYREINDLIQGGDIDLAFVCTTAYVTGQRDFAMELLAAPQVAGETIYHSLIIVPASSPAQTFADLQGKVFAFTDPLSTTGRNYPLFLLAQMEETEKTFFGRTFFTYSHDDAIRAVANKVAEGAAVDSLVYAFTLERDPVLVAKTRIIHQSPAFGIPPVVIGSHVRPQLAAAIQDALLSMADTENGRFALQQAGFEKFVLIDDTVYDSVRQLEQLVNDG